MNQDTPKRPPVRSETVLEILKTKPVITRYDLPWSASIASATLNYMVLCGKLRRLKHGIPGRYSGVHAEFCLPTYDQANNQLQDLRPASDSIDDRDIQPGTAEQVADNSMPQPMLGSEDTATAPGGSDTGTVQNS